MVKLVDTPASGVGDASRGGSSPLLGTKHKIHKKLNRTKNPLKQRVFAFLASEIVRLASCQIPLSKLFVGICVDIWAGTGVGTL